MFLAKNLGLLAGALASLASVAFVPGDAAAQGAVTKGGTLIYLEQQPHTNLYPPAGGFYPNGGVLNQITDKLTYQNPKTLEIEPWIAESWKVNADATEYTFKAFNQVLLTLVGYIGGNLSCNGGHRICASS